ncbi:MAG TPA: methyltransferase domain-containing protein [Pirellulaceae bacterium]|nr:methyltransferase domain-containing protein [Pirellulaceae bacterium]
MDQPDLDVKLHQEALVGLQRINWLSGIAPHFWRILKALARNSSSEPLQVLDVASGGGDIPIRLALRAARTGVKLQFSGCDVSPTAVAAAQQAANRAGAHSLVFFQHDVLCSALPSQYDVVMCSLFLHHLSAVDAEMLLRRMAAVARQAVLVDDLLRTRVGYFLAWAGCRLLTRSPVVHRDGPLSVRAAFSWEEAQALAARAGLSSARFSRHWPQRYFMHWSRT